MKLIDKLKGLFSNVDKDKHYCKIKFLSNFITNDIPNAPNKLKIQTPIKGRK